MESNVAKPLRSSDPVEKETEDLYDFTSQLKLAVESEWAKTSTNTLEKKNQKGKSAKKNADSSSRQFKSANFCVIGV